MAVEDAVAVEVAPVEVDVVVDIPRTQNGPRRSPFWILENTWIRRFESNTAEDVKVQYS